MNTTRRQVRRASCAEFVHVDHNIGIEQGSKWVGTHGNAVPRHATSAVRRFQASESAFIRGNARPRREDSFIHGNARSWTEKFQPYPSYSVAFSCRVILLLSLTCWQNIIATEILKRSCQSEFGQDNGLTRNT